MEANGAPGLRVLLELDEAQARELERLLAGGGPDATAAVVRDAVARYLTGREQLAHRRAVMEAILTGEAVHEAQ